MTKLCRTLFKCEDNLKNWLIKLMHSFEAHSNESACRKSGFLGLEQVQYLRPTKRCHKLMLCVNSLLFISLLHSLFYLLPTKHISSLGTYVRKSRLNSYRISCYTDLTLTTSPLYIGLIYNMHCKYLCVTYDTLIQIINTSLPFL